MADDSLTLIFRSGVARIDASGNVFVHVTHSADDPAPVAVGGEARRAPGDVRRFQVAGPGSGAVQGEFPSVNELPRGLLMDLRGFDSAEIVDGALVVTFSVPVDVPPWCTLGVDNVFERPAETLRLWAKSSMPDGVTRAGSAAAGKAAVRTQGKRTPTLEKVVGEDAPSPRPEPPPPKAAPSTPYRPDRLPAGAYAEKKNNASSGLGCSTLVALAALAGVALALLA